MLKDIKPVYFTRFGKAFLGNALDLLDYVDSGFVNLVITSPPFALQRMKEYGG